MEFKKASIPASEMGGAAYTYLPHLIPPPGFKPLMAEEDLTLESFWAMDVSSIRFVRPCSAGSELGTIETSAHCLLALVAHTLAADLTGWRTGSERPTTTSLRSLCATRWSLN
jgi:hypothetical protein